ncbi:TPA: hypothetical protein DCX15_02485 [bacterium]|nr:hypothetical protein [bacterium]
MVYNRQYIISEISTLFEYDKLLKNNEIEIRVRTIFHFIVFMMNYPQLYYSYLINGLLYREFTGSKEVDASYQRMQYAFSESHWDHNRLNDLRLDYIMRSPATARQCFWNPGHR